MVVDLGHRGLPDYCRELLATVRERTGLPLRVAERADLAFESALHVARAGESEHVVAYLPAYRRHRAHLAVTAAYKVLRVFAEPAERRAVAWIDPTLGLRTADERELARNLPHYDPDAIRRLSRDLRYGVVRQVVSFPTDLRVEREVAASLPTHADRQLVYLARRVASVVARYSPEADASVLGRTYRAVRAMNAVLAMEAEDIVGIEEPEAFRASPHRGLAEELRAELHAVKTPGHVGDREAIDRWARLLHLKDTYQWSQLDHRA